MATVDVGILNVFVPIITFIFIFTILFAIFEKSKVLGDNKGISSLVAFLAAIIVSLVPEFRQMIIVSLPWFFILFFITIFIIVIFMFVGISGENISNVMGGSTVVSTIVIISIIILIVAFTSAFGEKIRAITETGPETASEDVGLGVGKILFNPKILGGALLILIASQVIRLVAITPKS